MLNSKIIKVIHYKKIIVSMIFGLLGFWLNFHAVHFMQFADLKVSILFGLLLPLIISLFWGWKYGLLSALFGGCQAMWWLWSTDGFGTFYAVPVFTLWIVWHGFWADYRRTHEHKWYNSLYVVEIVFRIFSIIGFYTVFRWLVSLNPPPWAPQLTNNFVPYSWINFVMIKHVITAYILLLFCDVLRHFEPVRKLFLPKEKMNYKGTTYIISASMLIGLLFWIMHTTMDYFVFYKGKDTFLNLMSVNIPITSLFVRNITLLIFLLMGVVLSRIYLRLHKKDILIRESEEKYRKLISTTSEGFWLLNNEKKTIEVNQAFSDMLGYSNDEMLGKTPFDFVDEENLKIFKEQTSQITSTIHRTYEISLKKKNGINFPTIFNATSLVDENGNPAGSFAFVKDITEHKQTEYEIKTIFNTAADGMRFIGKDYKIKKANNTFFEMVNLSKDNVIGSNCYDIFSGRLCDTEDCPMIKLQKTKEDKIETEITKVRSDGKRIPTILTATIFKDSHDNFTGIIEDFKDITKYQNAENQIKKDLKIKTALIQEIYHRTKNNMAVVSAMLSMKSRCSDNDYVKSTFKEINNKIQAMSLVHQKLYKAKDLSNINLKDYIEDLANLIMQSYGVLSERIKMKFDLQDVRILIDSAVPLGLIINELVSNIFKHAFPKNQEGEIFIRLFKEEDETINLELIDNGIGFSQNFNPRKDGSMGLASVFSIAENQLKGEISVKSENGLRWYIKIKDDKKKERV